MHARINTEKKRLAEMQFLGMAREVEGQDVALEKAKQKGDEQREIRKLRQNINMHNYDNMKTVITDEIDRIKGPTMMEDLLKQRRNWINEHK